VFRPDRRPPKEIVPLPPELEANKLLALGVVEVDPVVPDMGVLTQVS
jgi:hypothetical protein